MSLRTKRLDMHRRHYGRHRSHKVPQTALIPTLSRTNYVNKAATCISRITSKTEAMICTVFCLFLTVTCSRLYLQAGDRRQALEEQWTHRAISCHIRHLNGGQRVRRMTRALPRYQPAGTAVANGVQRNDFNSPNKPQHMTRQSYRAFPYSAIPHVVLDNTTNTNHCWSSRTRRLPVPSASTHVRLQYA